MAQKKAPQKKTKAKVKPKPNKPALPSTKVQDLEARLVDAEVLDRDYSESTNSSDDVGLAKDIAEKISTDEDLGDEELQDWAKIADEPATTKLPAVKPATGLVTTDSLTMYLNELRRYPMLTREQEQHLAKKYFESKDPNIAQELVKANLRFVVKVAAEYSRFGAKMIDLVQEGNVGLMHAVREFNPYKGVRLITYAVWWIRGYIQEFLMRQHSIVRIGTTHNQRKLFYRLQKEKEELEKYGSDSSLALLSTRLGIPQDEVQSMVQRMAFRDLSLDKPIDEYSNQTIGDFQSRHEDIPLDEKIGRQEELEILRHQLAELRPELNEREIILLEERILSDDPLTLQEIGEKYGITREAVRQAEVRLMNKIKQRFHGAEISHADATSDAASGDESSN